MADLTPAQAAANLAAAKKDQAQWKAKQAEIESKFDAKTKADLEKIRAEEASLDSTLSQQTSKQREIPCPFCASHVQKSDLNGGRTKIRVPFLDPSGDFPLPPWPFKKIKPDPSKCSCKGKQTIKDVSDDTAKYQQVQQEAQANIQKSIELEAKLGTGGNRTTFVEKSDTLFVGLGFNKNSSYEVIPKGNRSPGRLAPNPKAFGFAEGFKSNAVEGKQTSVGWPSAVGNYKIVCANSFDVTAGAGGIKLNTKGPLTFNSGILNLTGPQVNIGSSSGPLTLEGDVVSVTGKTITLTPTDGSAGVYVKGSIHTPANVIVGGKLHAESLSFCKASCAAKDVETSTGVANPGANQTMGASWAGPAIKGLISSIFDIQTFIANGTVEVETAATYFLAPNQIINLAHRVAVLAKMGFPIEPTITGICFTAVGPGIVFNFPHIHGIPALQHIHKVRVPDLDYKDNDSPQSVRARNINDSLASNSAVTEKNTFQRIIQFAKEAISVPGQIMTASVKLTNRILQLF